MVLRYCAKAHRYQGSANAIGDKNILPLLPFPAGAVTIAVPAGRMQAAPKNRHLAAMGMSAERKVKVTARAFMHMGNNIR